jgi:tetratricopeptide (TPR) repeat protein
MDHVEIPESTRAAAEVLLRVREAERCLAAGTASSLATALAATETALQWVRDQTVSTDYSVAWVKATALLVRGNCLRELATSQSRLSALSSYDEALTVLRELDSVRGIDVCNLLANVWTNRGIALLNEGGSDNLTESIISFDKAIECRRNCPDSADPWIRYGLAAGWMNRGDALTRLGDPNHLALALAAYDESLDILLSLHGESDTAFRQRTAIAWMNRGITLQAFETEDASRQAIHSFEQAEACVESLAETVDTAQIRAAVSMNHANALLQSEPPNPAQAYESACKAITCSQGGERQHLRSAEVGLKARYILCQALALLLEAEQDNRRRDELFAQATDAVDEGMELVRHWNATGSPLSQTIAHDLFRFGARVYQAYQPHFLTEFLLETLEPQTSPGASEPNPEMHLTAVEAVWQELRKISRNGFKMVSQPEFDSLLDQLRLLRVADERLTRLREQRS